MKYLKPKAIIIAVIIVLAVGIFFASRTVHAPTGSAGNTNAAARGPQTYADDNFNFSLTYPEGWSVRRLNTLKTTFFPDAAASRIGSGEYMGDIMVKVELGVAPKSPPANTAVKALDAKRYVTIFDVNGTHQSDGIFKTFVDSFQARAR